MQKDQLQQLISTIKLLSLKNHTNTIVSQQQMFHQLQHCQLQYNSLLMQSLQLINLIQLFFDQEKYNVENLMNQLDVEKVSRCRDAKDMQDHVQVLEARIVQLKAAVCEKQAEIDSFRAEFEDRQNRICQMQAQNAQNLHKIQQQLSAQLKNQLQSQETTHQKYIRVLNDNYDVKISQLQQEIKHYLNQNSLLSNRLEELMRYIQVIEQQKDEASKNQGLEQQISPRIICRYRPDQEQSGQRIGSMGRYQNSCKSLGSRDQDIRSQETNSPQRLVLHEILNTQDRKSLNYGEDYLSKPKQYFLNSISNENINSINNSLVNFASPQLSTYKLNIIQQFSTGDIAPYHQIAIPEVSQSISQTKITESVQNNPYHIFFTLLTQCAKIDSGNLEEASKVNLSELWQTFLQKKVPLHEWYNNLLSKIKAEVCINANLSN